MKYGRYKIFSNYTDMVIAESTFAKQPVRGVVHCDIKGGDTFDLKKGIDLAIARCDAKIAKKRRKTAIKKFVEAKEKVKEAEEFANKMENYLHKSIGEYDACMDILVAMEDNM
jgi:hypothetical protein